MVNESILPVFQKNIKIVQSNYLSKNYEYGRVPNCFWNALEFSGISTGDVPRPVSSFQFVDFLAESHQKALDPAFGDILAFVGVGEIRDHKMINNTPRRVWSPFESTEHAAVYLGGGLIFQKENIGSSVFSIDTLENSQGMYKRGYRSRPNIRGDIEIEVWRKN